MAEEKFPICIKKKNGFMLSVAILFIICGIIYGVLLKGKGGILPMIIFVGIGIIYLLTLLVEYSRDIYLKDNCIEFYNNKDLVQKIKYSEISIIDIKKGDKPADKKKDFFCITYDEGRKKNKPKRKHYSFGVSNYAVEDLVKIREMINAKKSDVKISSAMREFGQNNNSKANK